MESPYFLGTPVTSCDCNEIKKISCDCNLLLAGNCTRFGGHVPASFQDLHPGGRHNQVNGVPMCACKDLLQKTRDEWGFKGYAACPNSEFVCLEPWTLNMSRTAMNFNISTPDPSIFIIVYVFSSDSCQLLDVRI